MVKLNKISLLSDRFIIRHGKVMIMNPTLRLLQLEITGIIIIIVAGLLIIALLAVIINNRKYRLRYRRFYRRFDKIITKKFNGNMLIENLINKYAVDNTNTYKSLKSKGKSLTKRYFEYYSKKLPELVLLKSYTTADKNRNELVIIIQDENERLLYQWTQSKKIKGLIKAINKYQMLTPMIAFLYELPLNINENKPYHLVNHENDNVISYEIVKNTKKSLKSYKKPKNSKSKSNKKDRGKKKK